MAGDRARVSTEKQPAPMPAVVGRRRLRRSRARRRSSFRPRPERWGCPAQTPYFRQVVERQLLAVGEAFRYPLQPIGGLPERPLDEDLPLALFLRGVETRTAGRRATARLARRYRVGRNGNAKGRMPCRRRRRVERGAHEWPRVARLVFSDVAAGLEQGVALFRRQGIEVVHRRAPTPSISDRPLAASYCGMFLR